MKEKDPRTELVELASALVDGRLDWLEGIRKICGLRFQTDEPNSDVFIPFRAAESELDHVPELKKRQLYDEKYLKKVDREVEEYVKATRVGLIKSCRLIIERYGGSP